MGKNRYLILFRNYKPKLFSVFLAVLLWAYVYYAEKNNVIINVPLIYKGLPDSMVIANKPPRFIKLEIEGDAGSVKFPTGNLKAEVNLKNARPGEHSFAVFFDKRQIPEKTQILSLTEAVGVVVEEKIVKNLWIHPLIVGSPDPRYSIASMTTYPKFVQVTGSRDALNGVDEIRTYSLDISNEKNNITRTAKLEPLPDIKILSEQDVRVDITLQRRKEKMNIAERTFNRIPVNISGGISPSRLELDIQYVDIVVHGENAVLRDLTKAEVFTFVIVEAKDGTCVAKKIFSDLKVHVQFMRFADTVTVKKVVPPVISAICRGDGDVENDPKPESGETPEESPITEDNKNE